MLRKPSIVLLPFIICLFGVVLSGCGQLDLDTGQVAAKIKDEVIDRVGDLAAVTCPHQVMAASGKNFKCTVHGPDGSKLTINVRQSGAAGNIVYTIPELIDTKQLEQQLSATSHDHRHFSCPDLVEAKRGVEFVCSAKGKAEKGKKRKPEIAQARIRLDKDNHLSISWGQQSR